MAATWSRPPAALSRATGTPPPAGLPPGIPNVLARAGGSGAPKGGGPGTEDRRIGGSTFFLAQQNLNRFFLPVAVSPILITHIMQTFSSRSGPGIRCSAGAATLQRSTGFGQRLLLAADSPDVFSGAHGQRAHPPASSLELDGLLFLKQSIEKRQQHREGRLSRAGSAAAGSTSSSVVDSALGNDPETIANASVCSSSAAAFPSTWSVPFRASGTLARADIKRRRQRRMENVRAQAKAAWRKRALWRARRLGFSTRQAEKCMTAFQKYCNGRERNASSASASSSPTTRAGDTDSYTPHIIRKAVAPHPSPPLPPHGARPARPRERNRLSLNDNANDVDDGERSFTMHSGELALSHFRGQPAGVSTAEAAAQIENERIINPRLSLGDFMLALRDLFLPRFKDSATGEDYDSGVENPEDTTTTKRQSTSKLADIAKWLLGRHSSTGFLDVCEWMSVIKSGDIQRAETVLEENHVAAYTQADRKRGTFRPTKGHMRPHSASISPRKPAYTNIPKIMRARKKKNEIMSAHDLRRIRNYVLHRGRLLGLSDRARLEAANEAVERARAGGEGFADYGAATRDSRSAARGDDSLDGDKSWEFRGREADRVRNRVRNRGGARTSPNRRRRLLKSAGSRRSSGGRSRQGQRAQRDGDVDGVNVGVNVGVGVGRGDKTTGAAAKGETKHHSLNFYTVDDYHDLTDSHHSRVFVKLSAGAV